MGQELKRLNDTNFFRDKPADISQATYLHVVGVRQARRFGVNDYLARHYIRLSTYAKSVGV
jgi:hypothetical protein